MEKGGDPFAAYRADILALHDFDAKAAAKARGILEKHQNAVEALEKTTSVALAKLISKQQKVRAASAKKEARNAKRGSRTMKSNVQADAASTTSEVPAITTAEPVKESDFRAAADAPVSVPAAKSLDMDSGNAEAAASGDDSLFVSGVNFSPEGISPSGGIPSALAEVPDRDT